MTVELASILPLSVGLKRGPFSILFACMQILPNKYVMHGKNTGLAIERTRTSNRALQYPTKKPYNSLNPSHVGDSWTKATHEIDTRTVIQHKSRTPLFNFICRRPLIDRPPLNLICFTRPHHSIHSYLICFSRRSCVPHLFATAIWTWNDDKWGQ